MKYPRNESKFDCEIFGIPGMILKVRSLIFNIVGAFIILLGVSDASCWLSTIFWQIIKFWLIKYQCDEKSLSAQ